MVELKNITSFKDFIFEASIPSEFSNETGFSKSLVGRGIFSLLRYIKQGVDYMKLEYLKRKLENEYFAGWLRYCALKQIDLIDGTMPERLEELGGEEDQLDNENSGEKDIYDDDSKYCNIFSSTQNEISSLKTDLETAKSDLETMIADTNSHQPDEIQKFKEELAIINSGLTCCQLKRDVNLQSLIPLKNLITSTGLTFDANNEALIIGYLDKILFFVKEALKFCEKYMFMDEERNMLRILKTCTNQNILNKIGEINAVFASSVLDSYHYINESLTSGINKSIPITQMIGDVLNTDQFPLKANPYEYLKKMGINRVEDINFQKLNDLWKRENLKDEATKLVNVDGVKKIQYSASRYIYRIKKTPTYTGITPERGGGVMTDEDSALRTSWEKKVEKVRSEWSNFLNVDTVDPFKLLTLQEAYRKNTGDYKNSYDDVNKTTDEIIALSKWKNIGLTLKGSSSSIVEGENFIVECFVRGIKYNIILNMHKSDVPGKGTVKTFRYVGNIDVKRMLNEEIWKKDPSNFQSTLKNYVSEISSPNYLTNNFNDIKTAFNFEINNTNYTKIGRDHWLHGIYFITRECDLITVSKSDTDKSIPANIKIVFFYTDKTTGSLKEFTNPGTSSSANFKIKSYKDGVLNINEIVNLNVGDITDLNYIKFGRLALINPTFKNYYFPPKREIIEPINGDDAGKFITFKK